MVFYERVSPCDSYGDVNDDGVVSYEEGEWCDTIVVANYIYFGWDSIKDRTPLTEAEFISRADVNNDGEVSMADATLIVQYARGTINTLPVCEGEPSEKTWWQKYGTVITVTGIVAIAGTATFLYVKNKNKKR